MTTMNMRERREKIEQLVQQNPRVQTYANTFNEAKADLSQWHEHNDALCATNGALHELDELLIYSKAALDDLKHAKTTAYNQLMEQYPRVWDTTCDDPFFAETQTDATEAGAETEEMEEVPTPTPLIHADKLMGILDREEDAVKVTIESYKLWDLDASDVRARLATIQAIRTQLEQLIYEAKEDKEDKENNNTNCGTFINWNNCPPYLDFDRASKKLLVSLHAEQEVGLAAERNSITGKELQKFFARSEEAHKDFVESALEIMYTILLSYPGYHKVAAKLDFGGNNQTDMASETTELGDEAKEANHA